MNRNTSAAYFYTPLLHNVWFYLTAIGAIQQEAANAGACKLEGSEVTIPENQAYMVWISNDSDVTNIPADTSDVFTTHNSGAGKVWVVGPFADPVPDRSYRTFSTTTGEFWAVCVE